MNLYTRARAFARRLADGLDRMLHPLRRRALMMRLQARPPRSILFVCAGNICRSPYAELVAQQRLGPAGYAIYSSGFLTADRSPPAEAVAAAQRAGFDLSQHRSRILTPALVASASLIVVMDAQQRMMLCRTYRRRLDDVRLLGDFEPNAGETRAVRDPLDQPAAIFQACYARIDRCVAGLEAMLEKARTT